MYLLRHLNLMFLLIWIGILNINVSGSPLNKNNKLTNPSHMRYKNCLIVLIFKSSLTFFLHSSIHPSSFYSFLTNFGKYFNLHHYSNLVHWFWELTLLLELLLSVSKLEKLLKSIPYSCNKSWSFRHCSRLGVDFGVSVDNLPLGGKPPFICKLPFPDMFPFVLNELWFS